MSTLRYLKGAPPGRYFSMPEQDRPCSGTPRIHREDGHHE